MVSRFAMLSDGNLVSGNMILLYRKIKIRKICFYVLM